MSNNFGVNGIIILSLFFLIMKENLNSKEFCKITEFKSFDYNNCSSGNLLFVYINYFSDFSDFKYIDYYHSINYTKFKGRHQKKKDTDFLDLIKNEWQPSKEKIHFFQNLQEKIIISNIKNVIKNQ